MVLKYDICALFPQTLPSKFLSWTASKFRLPLSKLGFQRYNVSLTLLVCSHSSLLVRLFDFKTRSLSCLLLLTVPQLPELGKPSPRSETTCDVVGFSANCERRLRLPRLRNALRCCDLQNFAVTLAAAHSSPTTDRRRRQDARKVLRSHTAHQDTDQKSECEWITPNNEQQPQQTTDRCSPFSGSPSHHL